MDGNRKISVMGIVNLTDDSYYKESRCADVNSAMDRIGRLVRDGADIIDIGACSTRPGAHQIGASEEWRRLGPVVKEIRKAYPDVMVSVDTIWSEVVSRTYDVIGDFIVNDISAGEDDPRMLGIVGSLGLAYVAMHKRGDPASMQSFTDYNDVVSDVLGYFERFSEKAACAGIRKWIVDPGFGFSKTLDQNWNLLSGLDRFKTICDEKGTSRPLLIGVSRKSMIYNLIGSTPELSLPATQVVHLAALQKGADILRVHDAAEARQTVMIYKRLCDRGL